MAHLLCYRDSVHDVTAEVPILRRHAAAVKRQASAIFVSRARKWGIEDLNKIYDLEELAKGDCIFAATGVTDGSLLEGVHRHKGCVTTQSIVMRASSGTVRRVSTEYHDLTHRGL